MQEGEESLLYINNDDIAQCCQFEEGQDILEALNNMKPEVHEVVPEYPFKQGAPYYGMLDVCEEDPCYLLKLMTLEPPKPYVPTFLRETEKQEEHKEVDMSSLAHHCEEEEEADSVEPDVEVEMHCSHHEEEVPLKECSDKEEDDASSEQEASRIEEDHEDSMEPC